MRATIFAVFLFFGRTLAPAQTAAPWRTLFDGRTFANFEDPAAKTPPSDSWTIRDGALVSVPRPRILEDLVTRDRFLDFELEFEWNLASGGNSGVKYAILERTFFLFDTPTFQYPRPSPRTAPAPGQHAQEYNRGLEFQLLDDLRHRDSNNGPTRRTGALYGWISPQAPLAAPVRIGEWNIARLVVRGGNLEHWINGECLLRARFDDPRLPSGVRLSPRTPSPIAFQNHADSVVQFRNIRIRDLPPD